MVCWCVCVCESGGEHQPAHTAAPCPRRRSPPARPPATTPRSNFANHNKLKRQALKVIASALPADEIAGLAEIFKSIDADSSGTITADELRAALQQKGSLLKAEELQVGRGECGQGLRV